MNVYYNNPLYSDFRIKYGDKIFYGHKIILSQIGFFGGLFSFNSQKEELEVDETTGYYLVNILKYYYAPSAYSFEIEDIIYMYIIADQYFAELVKSSCHIFFNNLFLGLMSQKTLETSKKQVNKMMEILVDYPSLKEKILIQCRNTLQNKLKSLIVDKYLNQILTRKINKEAIKFKGIIKELEDKHTIYPFLIAFESYSYDVFLESNPPNRYYYAVYKTIDRTIDRKETMRELSEKIVNLRKLPKRIYSN